jgi:hypothetical protein
MTARTSHTLNIGAVVLVLFTALIDPVFAAILAAILLVAYVIWDWVAMRTAVRR